MIEDECPQAHEGLNSLWLGPRKRHGHAVVAQVKAGKLWQLLGQPGSLSPAGQHVIGQVQILQLRS